MPSTYSPDLKIQLIATGEQSGVWGNSTNVNWNLIEQAVAGVTQITMTNANYTLTSLNGVPDEARSMVIVANGTNSAIRQIIVPLVPKIYFVVNNTAGGFAVSIGASGGAVVNIPTGCATQVFCDGISFYPGITGAAGNFAIAGNLTVNGSTSLQALTVTSITAQNGTFTNSFTAKDAILTGVPTAPTAAAGTKTTQIATTEFVTAVTETLGTMALQDANAVDITGGELNGVLIDGLTIGTNATGNKTVSTQLPSGGANGDIWYQV